MGREAELGRLEHALARARAGAGEAVFVLGEAGIGKTRLVTEAAAHARAAGMRVLWASAWEPGGAPPHWHWIQILRELAAGQDHQSLVRALGPGASEVSRLVPDLRAGVRLAAPGEPEGDDARFRMYDAAASFLRRASRRQALLLVLDDLHSADVGTIAFLRFVVADIGEAPIAVVGMAREQQGDGSGPDAADALTELRRRVVTVQLRGLGPHDVGTMLEGIVGPAEATRLTFQIHRRSGGNPLFVGELAHLLSHGSAADERLPLPVNIRSILERRLAVLPASSLEILRVAAVIGEAFSIRMLTEATGATRQQVLGALDHAVRAGIVVDRHPLRPELVFAHALTREALYDQLPWAARAALHRRIGEALETRVPDAPPAELAHHFLAGAVAVADAKAAYHAERAGHRAVEHLAYEDAAGHFRAAINALELPGADQHRRIPLLLSLGDASLRAGDLPAARDAFEQAAARARLDQRHDLLAQAALGLGSGLDGFEVRLFDHAQINLLEEALACLDDGPSTLRAWAMARLSVALTFAEPQPRRLQLAHDAVEMARQVDDSRALAYALAARCDATAGPEHIDDRLDATTEIVRLAHAAGDRGMELLGRRNRVIALLESGDIRGVDNEVDHYEMVAAALGQPLYQWYVPLWRGMRALMDGRLTASRAHGRDAAAIGARAQSHNAALNVEVLEWNTLLKEGRWQEAGDVLARQLELADGIYGEPFWVPLIASHAYPTEARAALDRLAASNFEELPRDAVWLAAMTYAADACAAVGHPVVAEQLYELILPHRSRFAVDAIGAACYGSMSRPLGVLATVMGRRSDAEGHFDDALAAHRGCGALALVAETLHDHGAALIVFGDAGRSEAVLADAQALYRSLGMAQRADLVMRAVEPTGRVTVAGEANVFRREGDYWTLAYGGRTVRVADAKGLRDIAALIARPGREFHVADLIAATDPADSGANERARSSVLRRGSSPDPLLDERARTAYRSRLFELRDDIEDAEANIDLGRAEAARVEMDLIAGELAAALGLSGRARTESDAAERARKAVTQRIRNAIRRLVTLHPELGKHLERSVRTGRFCSYSPEKPIDWSL